MRFSVWAPRARSTELELRGERLAMDRDDGGWYHVDADVGPGTDYRFVVDGDALADPRSGWQPDGVFGPSRIVDHAAFPWTDSSWRGARLGSAVVYELHLGTFTEQGTFDSAVERLAHVTSLGATAVEIMPVAEFTGDRGWGYDGVDLFAPHHAYGGPDGFKRLVDACHARGLAVVLDVVYNHLGPAGNVLPRFGPYVDDRHRTLWGESVNVDGEGSGPVRGFILDNACAWLRDYHVDGLRLDAAHAIVDTSATHILEELAGRVDELESELGRSLWLIAESDLNDPRLIRDRTAGGYGLDAQWSDDFHHAVHAALTGERGGYYADFGSLADVATALREGYVQSGRWSHFRRRPHGRPATGISGHQLLGYMQNHDQVGNRARGERIGHLVDADLVRVGAALTILSPFVPMLFAGEEWGATSPFLYFTDHSDRDLARAVTEGRRREFEGFDWSADEIPDPQLEATFLASKLDWSEVGREPHASLLGWYRDLLALRRDSPSLLDGRLDRVRTHVDERRRTLVMERGELTLACNVGDDVAPVTIGRARRCRLLLSSREPREGEDIAELAPRSVAVWSAVA